MRLWIRRLADRIRRLWGGDHNVSRRLLRAQRFFDNDVWLVRLDRLPRGRAALYRTARIVQSTVKGVMENQLTFRAAALTYYTVLSIVPFLAFAFSVLKGFGAYETFISNTVRPWLRDTFGDNPELLRAIEQVLVFVAETDVSSLGAAGLIFLVYISISLLANVEGALNQIWGTRNRRPVIRQVTDYTTLLVTAPILILFAITTMTAAQATGFMQFLREDLGLGELIDFTLRFTSVVISCLAMIAVYLIMPNVRTRLSSAAVGGIISGLLWQGALILHVQFQMGVARYNALYSGFGAIPIFLFWTFVSWVVVLLGAQIAASHQNEPMVRQRLRAKRADFALKETLAVAAMAHITRAYMRGEDHPNSQELADRLEVPPPTLEEILDALVRAHLLARTVGSDGYGYVPGRDLDQLRVKHVFDALRRETQADEVREVVENRLGPGVEQVLKGLEEDLRHSDHNVTLRALARLVGPQGTEDDDTDGIDGSDPSEVAQCDEDTSVLDAKQPDLPS